MSRNLLVQPAAGNRISGGYLYNSEMASHGAWELLSIPRDDLEATLDGIDGDLVIADSLWLTRATIAPFFRLQARGIRVAVMMHSFPSMIAAAEGGTPPRPRPTPFELEALERVGLVIAPGMHYARMLAGHRVQVLICKPGIADAWRMPPRRRSGSCVLVSVGAVTPRKGFRDVLEALAERPPREAFRWTIVGNMEADPAYAQEVSAVAQHFDGVFLVGQLPPDHVRELVIGADILVMPSYDENQPLVLLEAMAASVPAVAYAAGASAEITKDGKEGLIGPIGDRAVLARNLARLIDDESARFEMAEACWECQRDIPNWETAAQRASEMLARSL
jgi:glycosyltransferase involved in cell wall biosynthesis